MIQTPTAGYPVLRLGLIGCGMIARLHAQRLIADTRARIVGLFDLDVRAAERLRAEVGLQAEIFDDVKALIESGKIDATVICTPTLFHFDQIQACLSRGLHVLCEKPLADTRQRIVELIDGTRQGGPVLSVAYQRRYDRLYRTLRREVQSGRWGAVRSITSHNSERWQQTIVNTWRDDPAVNPGGFLGDAGSHKIDMLFFVTGLRPIEVFAHSDRHGSRVEIVTTVSGLLEGGVALSMNFIGDAQHWREDFHIHCTHADLAIREGAIWIGRDNQFQNLTGLEPDSSPDNAFLDMIMHGVPNDAPAECALPVFDFTQAVLESARRGSVVRIE